MAERVMEACGIPYVRGKTGGVWGGVKGFLHHPGLVAACVLSLVLYLWLGGMVWEVQVISPIDIDEDRVLAALAECGLGEGTRLSSIDPDRLVNAYLLLDSDTAFASIHLKGVVAQVELIPKSSGEEPENTASPCNLVASRDALITEVTVYSGTRAVRVGETVAKGDLLVSGVITDAGGTRILAAKADIRGQVEEDLTVEIPLTLQCEQVVERRLCGVTLTVCGRTLSFGKSGGGLLSERKQVYLFDRVRLPVSYEVWREVKTETVPLAYTEEEAERIASAEARQRVTNAVGDGTLLDYTLSGGIENGTYVVRAHIVYESNIAKSLAFEAENQ
jgi:similar to stage IV sporulation protein